MTNANLFLKTVLQNNNEEFSQVLHERLSALKGIEHVQIVKASEQKEAQVTISCTLDMVSLSQVEKIIQDYNAQITEITLALQSTVSGAAGPYSASSIALPVQEELKKIDGVNGAGISPRGTIKIELDPNGKDKQHAIMNVLQEVFQIKIEHQGFLDEEHK